MPEPISGFDHVAITVSDLDRSLEFYRTVLGGKVVNEHKLDGKVAVVQLKIGGAMFNVHRHGHSHPLVAARPTPGSVDLCFHWVRGIEDAVDLLAKANIPIIEGPVARESSNGKIGKSVYFRDPDGNLLELLTTSG